MACNYRCLCVRLFFFYFIFYLLFYKLFCLVLQLLLVIYALLEWYHSLYTEFNNVLSHTYHTVSVTSRNAVSSCNDIMIPWYISMMSSFGKSLEMVFKSAYVQLQGSSGILLMIYPLQDFKAGIFRKPWICLNMSHPLQVNASEMKTCSSWSDVMSH